jgi:signal transduction histidine kinase
VESGSEFVRFPKETLTDTLHGLDIIDERAQGMLDFVNKFRSLTVPPTVNFTKVEVMELLKGIERLFNSEIRGLRIRMSVVVDPESLCITADKQLLEQVLINLVTNSIHSLAETQERKIKLAAFTDYTGKVLIQVSDNGKGIVEEIRDRIFVPFFTTKEKGSGIGLSLSRQIMQLHNGKITFTSVPGIETVFTLVL